MAGKHNGLQAHVPRAHPKFLFVHCQSQVVNLCLAKACCVIYAISLLPETDFLQLSIPKTSFFFSQGHCPPKSLLGAAPQTPV